MKIFTINSVEKIDCSQTWETKAGATLRVLTKDSYSLLVLRFFLYDKEELKKTGDIRGLRTYTVRNQNPGRLGGMEFHRLRWEYVIGLEGGFEWLCEDLWGQKKISIISVSKGILLPPSILHTFKAVEKNSGLLVVCNTLFNPSDEKTWDSYPESEFRKLQQELHLD